MFEHQSEVRNRSPKEGAVERGRVPRRLRHAKHRGISFSIDEPKSYC